jgi:glycosyltransferase involved in cell wall biosynthesis
MKRVMIKVLLNCPLPFGLTHGGMQIQIEQTKCALEKSGVEVEFLRWWDDKQTGNVIQHFGRLPAYIIRAAQKKGIKVVLLDLLTDAGSRSPLRLGLEKRVRRIGRHVFPQNLLITLSWDSYQLADACVANTPWEARLLQQLFDAPAEKIHVVPNGVEEVFLDSKPAQRGKWLVCTATVTERKKVVELTEAAVLAEMPLWIIGKPYSENSIYWQRFLELTRKHPQLVRYEGPIAERPRLAQAYREARGFVLLSTMETLSLSAGEAAACGCPLLLSDLPWARTSFGNDATYCPITSPQATAKVLKDFYQRAPNLPTPPRPLSWVDVAQRLKAIYEEILSAPP